MNLKPDISRIEELVGDDAEMKKTLLDLYLKTLDNAITKIASLPATLDEPSAKIWKFAIHEIKGASFNLGFEELGNYCSPLENADVSSDKRNEAIETFRKASNAVRSIMNSIN